MLFREMSIRIIIIEFFRISLVRKIFSIRFNLILEKESNGLIFVNLSLENNINFNSRYGYYRKFIY